MNPALKRFYKRYGPVADAIAQRGDIDQLQREGIAEDVAAAYDGDPDFNHDLFTLLASDPLVYCAGTEYEACPNAVRIRIPMHLSSAPDGRSEAWAMRPPTVRCVSCGSRHFRAQRAVML